VHWLELWLLPWPAYITAFTVTVTKTTTGGDLSQPFGWSAVGWSLHKRFPLSVPSLQKPHPYIPITELVFILFLPDVHVWTSVWSTSKGDWRSCRTGRRALGCLPFKSLNWYSYFFLHFWTSVWSTSKGDWRSCRTGRRALGCLPFKSLNWYSYVFFACLDLCMIHIKRRLEKLPYWQTRPGMFAFQITELVFILFLHVWTSVWSTSNVWSTSKGDWRSCRTGRRALGCLPFKRARRKWPQGRSVGYGYQKALTWNARLVSTKGASSTQTKHGKHKESRLSLFLVIPFKLAVFSNLLQALFHNLK